MVEMDQISTFFILVFFSCISTGYTGSFWHLTDLHYDPWYDDGGDGGISCNEKIQSPGKYGDYECDSSWALVESSIRGMAIAEDNPDFLLWSGDNPPHVFNKSYEPMIDNKVIIELTQNITTVINQSFPSVRVLPMIGNHDYYPKNQLPGTNNALYNAYADMWSQWLGEGDMDATFRKGAYYSVMLSDSPKVRAVVLNTNLYYHSNDATKGETDPGGQLAWFQHVMDNAMAINEKVYLFTHVPFGKVPEPVDGKGWLVPSWNKAYEEAVIEYSDSIITTVTVHAHVDTFKIFYEDSGTPVASMFLSPSVTPWRVPLETTKTPPHNPGFRAFQFDDDTYEITDYTQYSLDLPRANQEGTANWNPLYNFRQKYKLDDMSPSALDGLLDEFREYASEKFRMYYDAVYLDTKNEDYLPCGCECKSSHLCAIEFVDFDKFDACYSEQPACGALSTHALSALMTFVCVLLKIII